MQKQVAAPGALGRSRPTNNQLLYKAHFRWEHYAPDPDNHLKLPLDTEACASVTAAFLKVLAILHTLEVNQQPSRNILMILANNTRRTKVLELSSGTHRIPDELKKHHLIDENGAQYSTNLDRNRYGNDNNYLFTVIKHDLETLGLCPCMVDVEIIDAKSQGDSQLVTAGLEVCSCNLGREPRGAPGADMGCYMLEPQLAAARNRVANADGGMGWNRGPIRSCRSENEGSQKFEALLVAADAAAEEQNEVDNLLMMNNRERRAVQPRRGAAGAFDSGDAMALRKRGPKRVHTGFFSVDTSELLGNISHLGQSGLAIADADADRGEVEQGPMKKGRTRNTEVKKDPDVNSEEGDTDARFRDDEIGMDEGTAPRHKKGIIPRRSSAIVMNHRQPQDMRRMSFELEHMRQMQMSRALDEETANRYEEAITKLQEDVQQIKEQVHTLLASNAESNKRASTLAMELAQSRQESSSLFKLLQDLLTQPRGAVPILNNSAAAMNLQALELPRRPGQNAGQGSELVQAPAPAVQEPEAPAMQKNAGIKPIARARGEHVPYVASPLRHNGSCEIRRAADAARSKQQQPAKGDAGLNIQLAPVAQLDATSGLNNVHRSNHNSEHVDTSRLTSLADVVSREDLEAMVDEQQWRNDEHEIKGLPKLGENFPSLSDLGSLFSAGQPSMELLKEIRRPPCATQSVTSPSSGMLAALNANANANLADRSATKERGVNGKSTLSYSTTNADAGRSAPTGQADAAGEGNLQSSGNGELQDMHSSPPFAKPDMPAKATEATC